MDLLFPLLALALAGALVLLPFVSLIRSIIQGREIAELRRRLQSIEERLRTPAPETPIAAEPDRPEPVAAPAPAAPSEPSPVPAGSSESEEDLEAILGGRWMLYVGVVVLLLGVAFFLKYAFDHAWLDRRARTILGALAGMALVPTGLRIASRGYQRYGHLVAGTGLVILYLTSYAALQLYGLISRPVANVLFLLITTAGALLADRRRSAALALLAICGGFATPLLVGGSRDAQLTLFTYVALLIAGTIYLARRHDWPALNAASYAFTVLLVALWADTFYEPAKYLRTELFLTLYCAMFLFVLQSMPRRRSGVGLIVGTAPILYYFASLAMLWDVRLALFVFLILFSGGALALAVAWRLDALRLAAWAAAALPFLGRIEATGPAWTTAMLTTGGAIVAMHLAAQVQRLGRGLPVATTDVLLLHANGVFSCVAAYAILERQWILGRPWMAWGLAAGFGALAWRIRTLNLEAALHWTGLAFALAGAGVAIRFDGPWVMIATALEGAAIAWIALRVSRPWFRLVGVAVFALACWQWVSFVEGAPPTSMPAILNDRTIPGLFLVVVAYALAWCHRSAGGDAAAWFTPLVVAAQVLTVAVLTAEATAYWQLRSLDRADASLAAQLSLSLLWAGYAAGLIVVGMWRRFAPIRYVAMVLFAITLAKIFLSDLAFLGGLYRVIGFLVIGVMLVLLSFLYQRGRAREKAHIIR
jgi:uncharacterized membrane protein